LASYYLNLRFGMQSNQKWLKTFLFSLITLIGLGALFVFDASLVESEITFGNPYFLFKKHLLGILIGFFAFLFGYFVPYKFWNKVAVWLYLLGILSLLAVFIPGIGLELNGAKRWLNLPLINFQSVEFFKFALIAFFTKLLAKKQKLSVFLLFLVPPLILLILQPDLGSLLLVLSISFGLYFFAGGSMKSIIVLCLSVTPLIVLAIIASPYRLQRLTTFLNPESDPLGASFHVRQMVVALGRGGWFGQGIGNSRQKYAYIPEASTDSIFAIVGEEIGFLGGLIIISLYLCLIISSYKLTNHSKIETDEQLFGLGIANWITLQTMLNLAAATSLLPLTGVPLPFFSYGRSSQIMLLLAIGVLMKIGRKKL